MSLRRKDVLYLLAVGVLAAAMALDVLSRAIDAPAAAVAAHASAGQPRDVDVERLRRLIREGALSDHEALYAKPADEERGKGDPGEEDE